ncbi:MAG TPA: preprotein translocase subunit YajC [Gemmataceae bacterium]|nr:preprotein translocase subunit YajC [Gemmataceae bacterium]
MLASFLLNALLLLAEDPPADPGAGGGQGMPGWYMFVLPAGLLLIYFLMMRPMKRQEAQRQATLAALKKGDKVLLNNGIIGTVVSISDKEDEAVIKLEEGKAKVLKSTIARNLSAAEADAKAAQDKKPEEAIKSK